jgi:hypothetical protein
MDVPSATESDRRALVQMVNWCHLRQVIRAVAATGSDAMRSSVPRPARTAKPGVRSQSHRHLRRQSCDVNAPGANWMLSRSHNDSQGALGQVRIRSDQDHEQPDCGEPPARYRKDSEGSIQPAGPRQRKQLSIPCRLAQLNVQTRLVASQAGHERRHNCGGGREWPGAFDHRVGVTRRQVQIASATARDRRHAALLQHGHDELSVWPPTSMTAPRWIMALSLAHAFGHD